MGYLVAVLLCLAVVFLVYHIQRQAEKEEEAFRKHMENQVFNQGDDKK